jgi:hypothetical protein
MRVFPSNVPKFGVILLAMSVMTVGQTRDRRVDDVLTDVALLKRVVKEQDRRIAELEKTIKSLEAGNLERPPVEVRPKPAAKAVPQAPWQAPFAWQRIKKDMSRAQVEELLGPPTSVDAVIDHQTLNYKAEGTQEGTLTGSVKLTDDRVSVVTPPDF